ncbi:hypothetical protein BFP76_09245 [Amylibacter kogurei]|uniref:Uncharacterized protein n=1 Tax=Paramylibacter kogurei TaxID=1889778 RepID=A0A2G5K385_9RHOB|nr:DUF6732 family protein [Amylibacter kogurei]PIB23194.1 hypothetical protein BFP76_09245 [Amylibacter kogurei]
MRILSVLCVVLFPNLAFAHVGHIGEVAGHGHIWGLIALGLAGAAAAYGARRAKKDAESSDQEEQAEEESNEAPQEA